MLENKSKSKTIICVILAVVLIGVSFFIYSLWSYKHPVGEIGYMISTGKEKEKNFYIESRSSYFKERLWFTSVPNDYNTYTQDFLNKNYEMFQMMNSQYKSPTEIYADCYIKDSKTYVHYYGTATIKETGENIKIDKTLEFPFIIANNILQYTPEERSSIASENR